MQAVLLLALCYVISGKLALMLALPPGYATAIFPPAGIAVASIMIGGTSLLSGVLLGAFILNVIQGFSVGASQPLVVLEVAAIIALASALQAWVGSSMLHRRVKPGLDSGRDVVQFLLLTPVMCLISASIAIPGIYLLHVMTSETLLANWITWWVGDTIGVVLTAPLVWICIGNPRSLWWRRRWLLVVPLTLSSVVFLVLYIKANTWEQEQQRQTFRIKSQQVGDALQYQFEEHERLLQALASVLNQKSAMTGTEFRNMARGYLDQRPELKSMSWAPRVTAGERNEFENWAQGTITKDFVIKQLDANAKWHPATVHPQYYPLTYVEPMAGNEPMLGYDKLSDPIASAGLLTAIQSSKPTASKVVALVMPAGGKQGILLSQVIKLNLAGKSDPSIGILTMVIQVEPYLKRVMASADFPYLLVRLEDVTNNAAPEIIADHIKREYQSGDYQKTLKFGGRQYQLTLAPTEDYLASHKGWQSWTALVCGFLLIGLLSAFLLLMSGQRAQIESVVADRTRKLHDREARLNAILNNAADAIVTIDREGKVISVNGIAGELFGYMDQAMQGVLFDDLIKIASGETGTGLLERLSKRTQFNTELTGRKIDGSQFPLTISVSLVEESEEAFFVCVLRDLTDQYRSREQIYQLAHHDSLTGLANRFTLNQRLDHLLALSRRGQASVAIMFIDLDHFKKINDSMGHQIGDQLLMEAADRLKKLLSIDDIVARPGGDEFVVVLARHASIDTVTALAERIIVVLTETYQLEDHKLHSGASIGISLFPSDGTEADTLLRNADAAMYVAKGRGRGNYQFFSSELNAAAHERLQIENQIWPGLERNEFELFLQPQMHLASRRIIGAEALIRWRHPELGMIPPDRFIPIAEESGLIIPLGEWVLERAMHILAGWQRGQFADLRLAINLSARQCHSGTLINSVDHWQKETGADLHGLEIEITETAAMQDPEQTRVLLREMRARGIKVAIDDFGTGYSSLSYLKIFAIDRIKIDRSFVKDIESDQNDALIASATIALAHNLGLEVIAEGVETEAQCAFLNHELCDEGQGYLFGRPMTVADFDALLKVDQTNRLSLKVAASA
ncbi:MAG TPA: EAL domain-containing protein [Burkholderiaceae bacterium]|jgi:diguanylate cyclase (GGDEF)-like protein/PAS domain S-box-containing protein